MSFKYKIKINTNQEFTFPVIENKLVYEEVIDAKVALLKHLLIIWHGVIPFPASDYKIDFDTLQISEMNHLGPTIMKNAQNLIHTSMIFVKDDLMTSIEVKGEYSVEWKIIEVEDDD